MSTHVHPTLSPPSPRIVAAAAVAALALAAGARYAVSQPGGTDPPSQPAAVSSEWTQDPSAAPPGIWVAPSGGPVGHHSH
jgi:hypothetical protein